MIRSDGRVGAADAFRCVSGRIYFPEQFKWYFNIFVSRCDFFPQIIFKLTNTISVINGSTQAGSTYICLLPDKTCLLEHNFCLKK